MINQVKKIVSKIIKTVNFYKLNRKMMKILIIKNSRLERSYKRKLMERKFIGEILNALLEKCFPI